MISLSVRHPVLGVAILLLTAAHVSASPVDITFSIDSFTSVVASPNSLPTQTVVNGQQINISAQDVPFTINGPLGSSVSFAYDSGSTGLQTPNVISFTPGPTADVVKGQQFLLGTFNFTNGIWFGPADVAFTMTTVSPTDPSLAGFTFQDTLHMQLNPFVQGNPQAGADDIYLVGQPCTATITTGCHMAVYELFDSPILPRVAGVSNAGSVQLFGMINSLDPVGLENATGGMFVRPPTATPAPPALLLFISGLVGLAVGARRRALFAMC